MTDYILTPAVKERLGLKNTTQIAQLVARGKLRGHKEGPFWMIEEASVREYAKNRGRDKSNDR